MEQYMINYIINKINVYQIDKQYDILFRFEMQ